ncbi:DMT family transporter [Rossellomorea sp. NS-SX7]|uniref:DMT family transporter n=1 Tax=Rossellomorea sp. NS-SX7 TaxID=3463856 RepID=UPI00405A3664
MRTYLLLIISILCEVTGATFMKHADGFSDYRAGIMVVICYALAVTLYIFIVKENEIGIINALWSGGGTMLVTLLGIVLFNESVTLSKFLGLAMILTGITGLTLKPGKHAEERGFY